MNRKRMIAGFLATMIGACVPLSTPLADEDKLRPEILNLKHKVERLEKSRKTVDSSKLTEADWSKNITLSGLVEIETGYSDGPDGSQSDISLATVELGIDAQVTLWVNAHVLILYEEDGSDSPEIDEGIVTLQNQAISPFSLAIGRMTLPFGNYESAMVSDPLTLEIGEIREAALQAGYNPGGFYSSAFIFNGETKTGGSESINQYGFNLGLVQDKEGADFGYDIGLSWTNNLADSNSLQDAVANPFNLTGKVSGYSIHALATTGPFTVIGEYLTASSVFNSADLAFNGAGAKPVAFNVEANYIFSLADKEAIIAIAWQGTQEALALALPESRYLATLSVGIGENTVLSFEYAHDEDYAASEGGSGEATDTITAQLAVVF
ncbi:MAG: LbtU family siderophore porin [gamma proteobacterium endosymbiont of Lamellibrachia anaximandri]|nr:LbtU family siderophore porin [gamma proteobacterium endosymbiont of Lamellibrachia anaximandri]MBL3617634.1 LbtU family siderophore porin [gamma proteobacterium endosymbiont of Lamellibrachia anaximandri]